MNEKAIEKLMNPPPDSKIAEAAKFGVDLTLLARNLRLTPEERINEMVEAIEDVEFFSNEMQKSLRNKND